MNFRLLSRLLGIIAMLIGATMVFSLPWAHPALGLRGTERSIADRPFETNGFLALLVSLVICLAVGALLMWLGRNSKGQLYRKEAMAVVGLSWVLATALGALPFFFAGVELGPAVRPLAADRPSEMLVYDFTGVNWRRQYVAWPIRAEPRAAVEALLEAGARGLSEAELGPHAAELRRLVGEYDAWDRALLAPGEQAAPSDRVDRWRVRWVRMGVIDCLFESQSGFSTTGATVISDLEDPALAPHCILFWRSSTHFLGGLGIIVLFVAILGQGSAGKALMRAEMPGPSKDGSLARMQHTAWLFASIYIGLTLALTVLLWLLGMTLFDALCHAFGTMATGGFSTYNASVGHFVATGQPFGVAIEYVIILFMILAGTNFTLLYYLLMFKPGKMLWDVEWRTYMCIILLVTLLVLMFGHVYGDFYDDDPAKSLASQTQHAVRYSLFQVVSIMTTTGYGTHDFDAWNSFGRAILLLLMFIGGCAGSTGGGMKVIRHVLFVKVLRLEIEQSFHPSVVRPLRIGGNPVDDPDLRKHILVYFGLILIIFVASWLCVVTYEPDATWSGTSDHKLLDTASAVAATLNNIGPGLGTVGATRNYGHFAPLSKILFTWLMMIGRLEIFAILVLFVPGFWRSR